MLKVLTPEEMHRADEAAIESGVASFALMRAAGRAVARAAIEAMGGTYGRRVAVLSGKGNNGGDGLVAAGMLARGGVAVSVLLSGDPADLRGDAAKALSFLLELGQRASVTIGLVTAKAVRRELDRSDLIVDALVGTGFRGALRGPAAEAAELVNRSGVTVLSVDIPSGVNGATGQIEGAAVRAWKTLTLAALKPGLLLHPGAGHAGEIEIADIGISGDLMSAGMELAEAADVAKILPPRPPQSHKRSVGKVLIVAGSPGMSGAAVLAATAALRAGAGLVWVAAPASVARLVEQSVTEAVVEAVPETGTGAIAFGAADKVLDLARMADSVVLGPGLSRDPETRELVLRVLGSADNPVVLDADGVNAYEGKAEQLALRTAPTVLTPHAGELARLLGEDSKQIESQPVESARRAARVTRATVLLKGHPTLVAGGDHAVAVNTGGPFLATAGTGDILTGVIAALAARIHLDDAAWAGAWLHGYAGRLAARKIRLSPLEPPVDRGIVASDLLQVLPQAIAQVRMDASGR